MAIAATSAPIDARTGDALRARDALWHVGAARCEREITFLRLQPAIDFRRIDRTLIHPFDRLERLERRERPRTVSRRQAMRALAELAIASPPRDVPGAVAAAPAALLPFQLEPLLALRTGLAARVLIADHVGLGKTIQAALIARDLVTARPTASILILTPAGLREQWQAELRERANLATTLVDADALRTRALALPPDVNPWRSAPIAIASIDFVKQADVLHGLRTLVWDLLVVDEAHALTVGSDRLAAAQQVARRSARIVLLTATPHDGDETRFRALCDLGRLSSVDALAAFRRTRSVAGALHRRVTRRIAVELSPAERRLHERLERYAQRVWAEAPATSRGPARLAMTVLFKRAASSPASLVRSLERRRGLLALAPSQVALQSALPFTTHDAAASQSDEDAEPSGVLGAPGLDLDRERTWLNLLIHAGQAAASDERKIRALARFVRRVREPVLVFTEYRDTLHRIESALARLATVATLHGGKTSEARAAALRAFDSGAARVLVATDAASEGLNLHRRCRAVVHVELPWSPTRLEQRIGRVDRLGQTRTVHTVHLLARHTVEARIEARLAERAGRIRDALNEASHDALRVDSLDPVASLDAALHPSPSPEPRSARDHASPATSAGSILWPRLRTRAEHAVTWLASARRLAARMANEQKPAAASDLEDAISAGRTRRLNRRGRRRAHGPLLARMRRTARASHGLPRGVLCVYRARFTRPDGRLLEQALVAIHVGGGGVMVRDLHLAADRLASMRAWLDREASRAAIARQEELTASVQRAEAMVALRHAAIAARDRAGVGLRQLPLFGQFVGAGLHGGGSPGVEALGSADPEVDGEGSTAPLSMDCHLVAVLVVG